MEYSIQQLSHLTGVTTRTLRWYDEIGLLKPSRVSRSGYRFYGPAEVDRLQDILYYRALGVELARIRSCLDDPSFDRLAALRSHLEKLQGERRRLDDLIRSVEDTIGCQERNELMQDAKKFEGLKQQIVAENEAAYGKEAREKYGDDRVNDSQAAVMGLSLQEYENWQALDRDILTRLEEAVRSGKSPQGAAGEELCRLHRRWLSVTNRHCDAAQHRGIAALYVADERFTAYYDRNMPGCARFLTDAVQFWAK